MNPLTCDEARLLLLDGQRSGLPPEETRQLQQHLKTCATCTRVDTEERVVSELLRSRLPRLEAPEGLEARIRQRALGHEPEVATRSPARRVPRVQPWIAGGLALAACALLAFWLWPRERSGAQEHAPLLAELVNDHLRVLYATQPLEVASSEMHQVKPWFSGRVDFAPDVAFTGDDEFPMLGGAVAYVIDRKAAAFIFKRRLHTISLFVFRADGLAWDDAARATQVGSLRVRVRNVRGFNVVGWRRHDLEHALVSDTSTSELLRLLGKLTPNE